MSETDRKKLREAAIAGWNACRKSIYAVCEDIQEKADEALDKPSGLARGPLESQHEHGFHRGEKSTAKGIARGFNAMSAEDDNHLLEALALLDDLDRKTVGGVVKPLEWQRIGDEPEDGSVRSGRNCLPLPEPHRDDCPAHGDDTPYDAAREIEEIADGLSREGKTAWASDLKVIASKVAALRSQP